MQASKVVVPASAANAGSPAVPLLLLARKASVPVVLMARPDERIMPLSMTMGVDTDLKVPLAAAAHVSTGELTVMPGPVSFAANTAAG